MSGFRIEVKRERAHRYIVDYCEKRGLVAKLEKTGNVVVCYGCCHAVGLWCLAGIAEQFYH